MTYNIEDILTIEEFHDLISSHCKLDVQLKNQSRNVRFIQVNDNNPKTARNWFATKLLPGLGIDFDVPRFTKKTRYVINIHPKYNPDVSFQICFKKGGDLRPGRANELGLQTFIKKQLKKNDVCNLTFKDNYGVEVNLEIVDVIDNAANKGKNGEKNRSDTTVILKDGSRYGISQKKTNASYVCKIKTMLKDILFKCEKELRNYAKEHNLKSGDYMSVRITEPNLLKLCWFGTDIAQGAAIVGNLEHIDSNDIKVERIIQQGDSTILDSMPIYMKWRISNSHYTMAICGVVVPDKSGKWVIDDISLPGINAPLPIGKSYRIRKSIQESRMFNERKNDLWDEVAYCSQNHKLLWLKYETVDDCDTISRRVAPYSYRSKRTKIRGKSTYFYADDYTPGKTKQIKCFLVDNCLDAKRTNRSFTPRFPIEIKMEIDKLEQQRKEKEENDDIENNAKKDVKNKKDTDKKVHSLMPSKNDNKKIPNPPAEKDDDNIKKDDIETQNDIEDAKQDGKEKAREDMMDMKDGDVISVTDEKGNEL